MSAASQGSAASPRGVTKPPDLSKPAGEIDEEAIISKIKKSRHIPRRVMVQRKKVFCSELKEKDDISYFLIENDGKAAAEVLMEFNLDGFTLDEPDEEEGNSWTIALGPGERALKVVRPAPSEKKATSGMGLGGGNAMAALMMDYAECAKGFSYKTKIQ